MLQIARQGAGPTREGAPENFTGTVQVNAPFVGTAPARVGGATVTFQPGARTAWHSHPLGQTLVVMSGLGWVQAEGNPVEEIRTGDVIFIPPNVKHWHGATDSTAMSHVAMTESLDGKTADWFGHVADVDYGRGSGIGND